MVKKIKVKNASIIKLQFFNDFPDGNLVIGEEKKSVPFPIKRFYFINSLFNKKAIRGLHAHKKLQQIILCINGSFELHLDDGQTKQKILMNDPYTGVYLRAAVWRVMKKFSSDCVILVVASDYYRESDYIRDYQHCSILHCFRSLCKSFVCRDHIQYAVPSNQSGEKNAKNNQLHKFLFCHKLHFI